MLYKGRPCFHSPTLTITNNYFKQQLQSFKPTTIHYHPQSIEMSHNVYKISYFGPARDRVAILVEPKSGAGERYIFAVKGHIHHDMTYGVEYPLDTPEPPNGYSKKLLVGIVSYADLVKFADVCEAIEPPKRQFDRYGRKLYPDALIRRSKEWVEGTLMALKDSGILEIPDNMLLD
jgi:hypothetical protein